MRDCNEDKKNLDIEIVIKKMSFDNFLSERFGYFTEGMNINSRYYSHMADLEHYVILEENGNFNYDSRRNLIDTSSDSIFDLFFSSKADKLYLVGVAHGKKEALKIMRDQIYDDTINGPAVREIVDKVYQDSLGKSIGEIEFGRYVFRDEATFPINGRISERDLTEEVRGRVVRRLMDDLGRRGLR